MAIKYIYAMKYGYCKWFNKYAICMIIYRLCFLMYGYVQNSGSQG